VQKENKVVFLDSSGAQIKELPIINSTGTATGETSTDEQTVAEICGTGEYVAIAHRIDTGSEETVFESTSTLKYYNAKGELLWAKSNYAIKDLPLHILSADGKRIFFVSERKAFKDSVDTYYYRAEILNEKGELVWDMGEYNDVYDFKITQNGRYGFFRFAKHQTNETGVVYFDVDGKKVNKINGMGVNHISDEGKVQIEKVLSEIEIHSDGIVKYWDGRKFEI